MTECVTWTAKGRRRMWLGDLGVKEREGKGHLRTGRKRIRENKQENREINIRVKDAEVLRSLNGEKKYQGRKNG